MLGLSAQRVRHSMAQTRSYFTDGAAYEQVMARWSRAVGEVFLDWLALPNGLRWLDVGCGTGVFTELVLQRCAPRQVSAIDPSADQIAYATAKPAAKAVSFRLGEAQALPFADDAFDVAAMALVISFIPEPATAIAEMKRVTKPSGTIATYIWDFLGKGYTQQPLREAIEALGITLPSQPGHLNSALESLHATFAAAGLDQVATRTIEIEVTYENFEQYWAAQTALANTLVQEIEKMTAPDLERLKNILRERLPKDKSARIAYKARANAVKGRVPV